MSIEKLRNIEKNINPPVPKIKKQVGWHKEIFNFIAYVVVCYILILFLLLSWRASLKLLMPLLR